MDSWSIRIEGGTALRQMNAPHRISRGMASTFACLIIPVLGLGQPIPNSRSITTYNTANVPTDKSVTRIYADGLNRPLKTLTENGNGDVATGTVYDAYGKPTKGAKPYYTTAYGHTWSANSVITDANSYFNGQFPERPNGGGKAYSETVNYPDPLGRPKEKAGPGSAFSIGTGKTYNYWYFSRITPDFVRDPTKSSLDAMIGTSAGSPVGAKYFLEIVRDPDDHFSQILKDQFGKVIKTWSDPTNGSGAVHDEIVTEFQYNGAGQLVRKNYPGTNGQVDPTRSSTYSYTSTGLLVKESHPDEGTTKYIYDRSGRLRFKQDENQRTSSTGKLGFTYICYDAHSREIETGIVLSSNSQYFSQDYADIPDFPRLNPVPHVAKIRKYYDTPEGLAAILGLNSSNFNLTNTEGRLVATVCFDEYGQGASNQIAELFSYNIEGQVAKRIKFMPWLKEQEIVYLYDLQGKITYKGVYSQVRDAGSAQTTDWDYSYDKNGRLVEIKRNLQTVMTYSYSPTGKLKDKYFHHTQGEFGRQSYAYNIQDWMIDIDADNQGTPIYSEELFYETGASPPQFNGNVAYAIERYWTGTGNPSFFLNYRYDMANRQTTTYSSTPYNEGFIYDASGRIETKIEGSKSYGPYEYEAGTNRALRIGNHPTRNGSLKNFAYDPKGNMVFDRSKKMAVFYDWRNLPIKFRFFTTAPAPGYEVSWDNVAHISAPVGAEVDMVYDASGKRVLKKLTEF